MEQIKSLPLMERPREKLIYKGAGALPDEELLAILLGSGTAKYPLNEICSSLMQYELSAIAQMDMKTLRQFKGIGPAKAAILLAAAEYCRRAQSNRLLLIDGHACYAYLRPILAQATQLQYILLLISSWRELLAFSETGGVLPDISRITGLAVEAGAGGLMLARNGWLAFSNAERRYLLELRTACAALGVVCDGLMAVGPERFEAI